MTQKTAKSVADVRARVAREARERETAAARADAFAHLQKEFDHAILRHDASGAVRVQTWKGGAIEWSPSFERDRVGFDLTFGEFRFLGEQRLTARQLEALQQYAAVVEGAPAAFEQAAA